MDVDYTKIFVKNVDTQLFEIVSNLICSICQELFTKPVTTPCGHSFCNGCIKRVLSSKDNSGCPLCKNPVKRYGLEGDAVKSTLIKITKELPASFGKDIEDLTKDDTDLGEDLIRTSKLFHLFNQENSKKFNISKQKSMSKRKTKKLEESKLKEIDSETFIPVLNRTKSVFEYASAKKKKMDDLISISQTEPASDSSLYDSSELCKKLKNIEKIPSEKKVNEWFNAVGDNIYISSPTSSIIETGIKNTSKSEIKTETKPTMIRRDYIKTSKNENNVKLDDPYEFVPSQNNNIYKKKCLRKATGKKIPDFRAFQSFNKKSIKRCSILMDESREEAGAKEEVKDITIENQVTASQKFDQLLSENKTDEKKPHPLYSASQVSSAQFLDVSFHSKIKEKPKKKTSKVEKNFLKTEDVLFKSIEMVTEEKKEKSYRFKRRRSASTPRSGKKKKSFSEVVEKKSDEATELGESVEKYLIKRSKKVEPPPTKLKELLTELLDDDIIYATRPSNAPVRLPDLVFGINTSMKSPKAGDTITQNTDMIGFCTQDETPYEKSFKRMVENMEKELNSSDYLTEKSNEKDSNDCQNLETDILKEHPKIDAQVCEKKQNNCEIIEEESENCKKQLVEFLRLGKLTPIRKRAKSTVVKLVFPIGLTSLARRHKFQNRCLPTVPVTKNQSCQVSTGIQTVNETVSCLVQTSQVPQSSFNMQTSQPVNPSVEIQTTQKWTATAEIQTSQKMVCQGIQTSQATCKSALVQTTQPPFSFDSNPRLPETPIRKPSHQHRKIVQKRGFTETPSDSPLQLFPPENKSVPEKVSIMDFEIENDETLQDAHENFVKSKNRKNKILCGVRQRSPDSDSDDSDLLPPKRKGSFRIFSQDSSEIPEGHKIPQLNPLVVNEVKSEDDEIELIDLDTPGSQNSEEQMNRVLKNIDLDMPKGKNENAVKGEKSEESDSDFFVEQTPPRPKSRAFDDIRSVSGSRNGFNFGQKTLQIERGKKENLENNDLIEDSLPKGFSESFFVSTAPQRIPFTPGKNSEKTAEIEAAVPVDIPIENDQNQLNANEGKTKLVNLWKRSEEATTVKTSSGKKLCVVASSVKNPDLIKKFVSKFKIDYSNKPTKEMTHLIVGLHENEDNEVLPLCTPKLLFAMANKKWVVNELWAENCLKMNVILPEDTFETLDPVGGWGCRKARLSNDDLLKHCEVYLLGEFQMISKEEFANLISDCGGSLVSSPEKFSFLPLKLRMIIADRDCLKMNEKQLQDLYQKHSTVILSRDAIIMSIQSYKLVNFFPYLLHFATEENLVKLGYPLHLVKNEEEEDEEDGNDAIA